jgi:hypothetical protein
LLSISQNMAAAELAGVIGTWVAVLLALVALFGVVAPIIIIRRRRSERYRAFKDIDDLDLKCLTRSSAGLPYLSLSARVPDLSKRPQLGRDRVTQNAEIKEPSRTGWVSLSWVLQAYGIEPRVRADVEIAHRKTWRPVNRLWLLAIGLLGRYGHRTDKGRARSSIGNENRFDSFELEDLTKDDPNVLFGNTGILQYCDAGSGGTSPDEDAIVDSGKVNFTLYSERIRKESQSQESPETDQAPEFDGLPLETLFWLSIGCMPLADGKVFDLSKSKPSESYRTRNAPSIVYRPQPHTTIAFKFDVIERPNLASRNVIWYQSLFNENLPSVCSIQSHEDKATIASSFDTWIAEGDLGKDGLGEYLGESSVILTSDVQRLALAILTINISPHGFLFDKERGSFGYRILCETCSLHRAFDWLPHVLSIADTSNPYVLAVTQALQSFGTNPGRFSRGLARTFYQLDWKFNKYVVDPELGANTKTLPQPHWSLQSVGILFIMDKMFQAELLELEAEPNITGKSAVLEVGRSKGGICFTYGTFPKGRYTIDFRTVFPSAIFDTEKVTLCYEDVLLAALRALLRICAFQMCLSSLGLLKFISEMDDMVYVSANPASDRYIPAVSVV